MKRAGLSMVALIGLLACDDAPPALRPPPGFRPGAAVIDEFIATPSSVRAGETVILSWRVSNAARPFIEILVSGRQLVATTDAFAEIESEPIFSDTVFELKATSEGIMAGRELTVPLAVAELPRIISFTATPNPAPLGSTVTLAWTLEAAAEAQLFDGLYPIEEAEVLMTRRAQSYRLVAENGFGSAEARLVVDADGYPPVQTEIEPNDRVDDANPVEGLIFGELEDEASADYFSVRLPLGGNLTMRMSDGLGGCALDPRLRLFRGSEELFNWSFGGCPDLGPIGDLDGGTYYVVVDSDFFADRRSGPYLLELSVGEAGCGNAILERTEQCDDGAALDGDGCSAQCQLEIAAELSPPGGSVPLELGGARGRSRYLALDVTREGQSITATASACGIEQFRLLTETLEPAGSISAPGPDACLSIDPREVSFFANLSPGRRILEISTSTAIERSLVVTVRIDDPICGNEIVEPISSEICDDGNVTDGDGCSSLCVFDGPVSVESEPNDDLATADPTFALVGGGRVTVTGVLGSADADVYLFEVPAGSTASLLAQSYSEFGDPTAGCQVPPVVGIELLDESASIANSTFTPESCARLEVEALPAGTYYLRVTDLFMATGSYFIDVVLEP